MAENVKAHGAAGDGVADDGVVWNNARASLPAGGGMVFVPAGSYALTTAFTFGGQSNVTVWISAGVTLSGSALPAPTGTNSYIDLRSGKITLFDVNLYRSVADVLKTDDQLDVGVKVTSRDGIDFGVPVGPSIAPNVHGDGTNLYLQAATAAVLLRTIGGSNNKSVWVEGTPTGSRLTFFSETGVGDTNLYREAANILGTDDKLHIVGEAEIDGALNHDGTTVGFFGTVPATQRPANADTSGATLAALETEVNELKQLLRDFGFLAT